MSFIPAQRFSSTIFGEIINAELTGVIQIEAANGLREDVLVIEQSASASVEDSQYSLKTGTAGDAFVSITSSRILKNRGGLGVTSRFSALFETSAADSAQGAGFFNDSEGFIFGYNGTEFGVGRFYDGRSELQYLQVTTAAGGAETATVTVDGTAYNVPLTAGTVNHNAIEISDSLNSQVPYYRFSANQDTVTALDELARTAGAFAFTSATAVATWTQDVAGIPPIQEWTPQADWDNPPDWAFDPSKGNIYQITFYWGYGGVQFSIGNPESGRVEPVHTIVYANEETQPFVQEPSFRLGWAIQHYGNTTPLAVKGAEAAGFVIGRIYIDERSRSASSTEVALNSTSIQNLVSVRNRLVFNRKTNRITAYLDRIILGAEHNKAVTFYAQIDATANGDLEFSYVDEKNSCVEFSTSLVTLNNDGRQLGVVPIRSTQTAQLLFEEFSQYLLPGETLSIGAILSSGTGGEGDCGIYWVEDQ